MAVAFAPFDEGFAVGFVEPRIIDQAGLVLLRDAVALQVADVGRGRGSSTPGASAPEPDDARLDDDAASSGPWTAAGALPAHCAGAAPDPGAGKPLSPAGPGDPLPAADSLRSTRLR